MSFRPQERPGADAASAVSVASGAHRPAAASPAVGAPYQAGDLVGQGGIEQTGRPVQAGVGARGQGGVSQFLAGPEADDQ